MANLNSTRRFSGRVENYIKYRPGYPPQVINFLKDELGFTSESVVADVGSGTGILAAMFLEHGNRVFGIEPNAEMRQAAEELLNRYKNYVSVAGTAEVTTLPPASVDLITAGQAFHWFDRSAARAEFQRLLKPEGHVVILWNDRRNDTLFLQEYEALLREFAIDYSEVDHRQIDEEIMKMFLGQGYSGLRVFDNHQELDEEGILGRVLSCSYMPAPEHRNYQPMVEALKSLFEHFQQNGKVTISYKTLLYYGQLAVDFLHFVRRRQDACGPIMRTGCPRCLWRDAKMPIYFCAGPN